MDFPPPLNPNHFFFNSSSDDFEPSDYLLLDDTSDEVAPPPPPPAMDSSSIGATPLMNTTSDMQMITHMYAYIQTQWIYISLFFLFPSFCLASGKKVDWLFFLFPFLFVGNVRMGGRERRLVWDLGLPSRRNRIWRSWMMASSGGSMGRNQWRIVQIRGKFIIDFSFYYIFWKLLNWIIISPWS